MISLCAGWAGSLMVVMALLHQRDDGYSSWMEGWAGLLIFSAVLQRSLAVFCSLQGQTIFTLRCSTGFLEDNGDSKLK